MQVLLVHVIVLFQILIFCWCSFSCAFTDTLASNGLATKHSVAVEIRTGVKVPVRVAADVGVGLFPAIPAARSSGTAVCVPTALTLASLGRPPPGSSCRGRERQQVFQPSKPGARGDTQTQLPQVLSARGNLRGTLVHFNLFPKCHEMTIFRIDGRKWQVGNIQIVICAGMFTYLTHPNRRQEGREQAAFQKCQGGGKPALWRVVDGERPRWAGPVRGSRSETPLVQVQ